MSAASAAGPVVVTEYAVTVARAVSAMASGGMEHTDGHTVAAVAAMLSPGNEAQGWEALTVAYRLALPSLTAGEAFDGMGGVLGLPRSVMDATESARSALSKVADQARAGLYLLAAGYASAFDVLASPREIIGWVSESLEK
ncbi:hypothetical protein BIV57_17995 [Mangrovactinospora gilvigrisea]|uniref:Uncharacterized protein n=1 Tax=Mangrovactinospora gilvigrisea TaxID=1428644 RepID=A0A1J7C917_9ACTN|nr:hypothetical protein [Mangrovactinospora gilvigrisea]OIV36130.1 hypothetical protein BIV57_17995 [Mangrovactinospora gilvigrisea]